LIKSLSNEKLVLVSSHDLSHVTEVCDRILILEKGKLVKDVLKTEETLRELEQYFGSVSQEEE
jgi:ABC-2 type transport system ATP-binding protein